MFQNNQTWWHTSEEHKLGRWRQDTQEFFGSYKLEASLDYLKPYLKKKKNPKLGDGCSILNAYYRALNYSSPHPPMASRGCSKPQAD